MEIHEKPSKWRSSFWKIMETYQDFCFHFHEQKQEVRSIPVAHSFFLEAELTYCEQSPYFAMRAL